MRPYKKNNLFEMAYSKRQIADRIVARQDQIITHLIKTLLKPDDINIPHWKQEIFVFLKPCHMKIKNTGKYPEASFYYDYFWGSMDDVEIKNIIINTIDSIFMERPEFNFEYLKNYLKMFFQEVSVLLSSEDMFINTSVYKLIK